MRVILSGERTALNYLQRMSGIATYTHSVAKLLEGSHIKLLDTRKTTPNMRIFEKYAVRVGGGYNHRYNLSDGVLIKDNHIGAAGGVRQAVALAREYAPFVRKIEIEVENLEMFREALDAGADIIMLGQHVCGHDEGSRSNGEGPGRDRVFRKYYQGKYRADQRYRRGLRVQRGADPFGADP